MEIIARAKKTDEIMVEMKISMTVKEWRELREQLPSKWPSWKLGNAISEAARELETTYSDEIVNESY